jgi:serine O-acetyltransferase
MNAEVEVQDRKMWISRRMPKKANCSFRSSHDRVFVRDTVKEWAGDSQWRALKADYQRFRKHGYNGWGSEGFWALVIYRAQRALRKSRRRFLWKPAAMALAVLRKALQIIVGVDLHPEAEIGAGLLIQHASQVWVTRDAKIGVDCTLSQVCSIGSDITPGAPKIGDFVYLAPQTCILGSVTIGDEATISPRSLVLSDVPADHTAIGVQARIIPPFDVSRFRNDSVPSSKGGHATVGGVASCPRGNP